MKSSSNNIQIQPAQLEEIRPLRHLVLRVGRPFEETLLPDDAFGSAMHFAAKVADGVVGCASVYEVSHPALDVESPWRLRAMGVHPDLQRSGIGRRLVEAAENHVAAHGGKHLWCDARLGAVPFYRKLGFLTVGKAYDVPLVGPHYLMVRKL